MRQLLTSMRFILLWIIGSVFSLGASLIGAVVIFTVSAFIATIFYATQNREPNFTEMLIWGGVVYSIIGLVFGLMVGAMQKLLLRQKTDESWSGWLLMSAIGGVIGVDILMLLLAQQLGIAINTMTLPPKEVLWLIGAQIFIIPFASLSVLQMFVLWRYVKGAWTWILANVVSGLVVYALLGAGLVSTGVFLVSLLALLAVVAAAPIVTGFAMLWLINFNWKYTYPEF